MDFQKSKCTCLEQLSILTVLILPKAGFTVDIVDFDVVFVVCVFCINRSLCNLTFTFYVLVSVILCIKVTKQS